jgi:hypothetical protein
MEDPVGIHELSEDQFLDKFVRTEGNQWCAVILDTIETMPEMIEDLQLLRKRILAIELPLCINTKAWWYLDVLHEIIMRKLGRMDELTPEDRMIRELRQ